MTMLRAVWAEFIDIIARECIRNLNGESVIKELL